MEKLTSNAIPKLLSTETGTNECLVVDLSDFKKMKSSKVCFKISDGEREFRGCLDLGEAASGMLEQLARRKCRPSVRVRITGHITHFQDNEPREIEIVDFEPLDKKPARALKLDSPEPPLQLKPTIPLQAFPETASRSLEEQIKSNLRSNSRKDLLEYKEDGHSTDAESPQPQRPPPSQRPSPSQQSQMVAELYESYYNWSIVVRVVDSTYKEFVSRLGKLIKLLTVELIDAEGTMIAANVFGETAREQEAAFKVGRVYRISRGKVTLDNYNVNKRENESRFAITLAKDSEVALLPDDPDIPYCRNNWLRLSQASAAKPEEAYNFIAVLAGIQQRREIPREGRSMSLQVLRVGDPTTGLAMEASIWDGRVGVEEGLVGKSVLLKKFKVSSKYKNQVTLVSTINSKILPHNFFQEYEGNCQFELPKTVQSKGTAVKKLVELSEELKGLAVNGWVQSTVEVWVKEVGFDKKWFYDACPRCRKSCGKNTSARCEHCQSPLAECNKSFNLPIRFADSTGSLWATAFDESAAILLKEMAIDGLFPMGNRELMEHAESYYCYEQYRVSLKSSRDMLGLSKHTICGRPVPVDPADVARGNLKRIGSLMEQLCHQE